MLTYKLNIYKVRVSYYIMATPEGDRPPGRPKKYFDGISQSVRAFYFPMSKENTLIWNEFVRICSKSKNPSIYAKVETTRKNVFLRQSIYKSVIQYSNNNNIREVALSLLLRDINERITKYNKDNNKEESITTMKELKRSFKINVSEETNEETQQEETSDQEDTQDQGQSQEEAEETEVPSAEELNN